MAEPKITIQAYHVSAGSNLPVHRVVLHATAPGSGFPRASNNGQAEGTAHYFQEPTSGGSAQYIRDRQTEEHCVRENAIAWHAPPNPGSIGIEICSEATYTNAEWKSDQVRPILEHVAKRVADICKRYGIPAVKLNARDLLAGKRGICGHVDVSEAWHQSDHTDPGPNFPWTLFIELVREAMGEQQHRAKPIVPGRQKAPKYPGRVLHLGMHGDDVHTFQMQMLHRGWNIGRADGQFGPRCVRAVRAFQQEKKLPVTGTVNKATWSRAFKAAIT